MKIYILVNRAADGDDWCHGAFLSHDEAQSRLESSDYQLTIYEEIADQARFDELNEF